ncbi:MAG: calcium/sodium antiporter [Paracoccaceae bacterium]
MTYVFFGLGLIGLFVGGELLVRGAVGVAKRFHVPPLVIGLTIVGFGTSTPELLVSLQAAFGGTPSIAIGNVIGSNIANILLILGVSAAIYPVTMRLSELRQDVAAMIAASLAFWLIILDGGVSRLEGVLLFAALLVYLVLSLRGRAGAAPPAEKEENAPLWLSLVKTAAGLVILMAGARLLVDSASEIARAYGVSEAVIGLTIIAVGTSLPELATSVIAALRKQPEISLGNIVGSNIFNILCILGLTAMVVPVPVEPRFAAIDIWVMIAAAFAFFLLAALAGRAGRPVGVALLLAYCGYVAYLAQG